VLKTLTLFALLLAAGGALADLSKVPSGNYRLDKNHGYITFSYAHMGFSHPFVHWRDFDVALTLDANDAARSSVTVSIQSQSIETGVEELDKRLRGASYFNVKKFPEIRFVSRSIRMSGTDRAQITGDLTIKDVTRPVTLEARLNKAGRHPLSRRPAIGISATATLRRSEWGLKQYVPMVSDEVQLMIETELVRTRGKAAIGA